MLDYSYSGQPTRLAGNVIDSIEKLIVLSIYMPPCFEDTAKNRESRIDLTVAYLDLF